MSKQFIYFVGVLFFMAAAALVVSAQENASALNNATLNNITSLNNTTLNASLNETFNATASMPVIIASNESVIEAAILPTEAANVTVPAAEETAPAANETALAAPEIIPVQNETIPAISEVIAAQNVTAPAQNDTALDNAGTPAETIGMASLIPAVSQPGAMAIGSSQRNVFTIGGSRTTPSFFSISGKALAQQAYQVGLPAETIMDLSALPFFINRI